VRRFIRANGTTLNTNAATSKLLYNHTSITVNQNYELQVTQELQLSQKIQRHCKPQCGYEALPAGLVDGINTTDATKATLVLDAPYKDFVYVAGSFK
jgi:hypothetical protein